MQNPHLSDVDETFELKKNIKLCNFYLIPEIIYYYKRGEEDKHFLEIISGQRFFEEPTPIAEAKANN